MPNEFITPEQFARDFMAIAARQAEKMPLSACEHLCQNAPTSFAPGLASAVHAALLIACLDRLERQPGVPEGAD